MKPISTRPVAHRRPSTAPTPARAKNATNEDPRVTHSSRRARPGAARTVAVLVAATVVSILAVACGGPSSTAAGTNTTTNSASGVGYSRCMRDHGVPNFPDPPPGNPGAIAKADAAQLGVSTTQLQAAQQACSDLIPVTGDTAEQQQETQCAMARDCSQAVVAQWMSGLRTLAQCLRTHGLPNWPDPVISQGIPHFPYDQAGIDHHSQAVLAKVDQCMTITGFAGLPLP